MKSYSPILIISFTERSRLEQNKETKKKLEQAKYELEVAQRTGDYEKASRLRFQTIPELETMLPTHEQDGSISAAASANADGSLPHPFMLHDRVTSSDIARVVAKATGIPVQNLLKGEKEKEVWEKFLTSYTAFHYYTKRYRVRELTNSAYANPDIQDEL